MTINLKLEPNQNKQDIYRRYQYKVELRYQYN